MENHLIEVPAELVVSLKKQNRLHQVPIRTRIPAHVRHAFGFELLDPRGDDRRELVQVFLRRTADWMTENFRVEFEAMFGERIAECDLGNDREEFAVGQWNAGGCCHALFVCDHSFNVQRDRLPFMRWRGAKA